jgi:hypothetical protein
MVEDLSHALSGMKGFHFNQAITDELINELILESEEDQKD